MLASSNDTESFLATATTTGAAASADHGSRRKWGRMADRFASVGDRALARRQRVSGVTTRPHAANDLTTTPAAARRRVLGRVAVMAVLVVVLAGCDLLPIPGDGPLRYRDPVFDRVRARYDLVYGTAVDQQGSTVTLKADLYRPAGDDTSGRPLIIWIHGGGFSFGDKDDPEIVDQATHFARNGYVTASITYRLHPPGCDVPDAGCIQAINDARADAQAAVRFFRARADRYGIDPDRIAVAGTSAGAITALGVAYGSDPTDQSAAVRGAASLSGAVLFTDLVDPSDPKTLLFNDTVDDLVPYDWAKATVQAATDNGLRAYLITWDDHNHACYWCHRDQILELETNFFYRILDAGNAGGT